MCQKIETKTYGGHGLAHIPRYVLPLMERMGITAQDACTIVVDNPRRMLEF